MLEQHKEGRQRSGVRVVSRGGSVGTRSRDELTEKYVTGQERRAAREDAGAPTAARSTWSLKLK